MHNFQRDKIWTRSFSRVLILKHYNCGNTTQDTKKVRKVLISESKDAQGPQAGINDG